MTPLRHLDLFSGIGGFARAVQWLDGETVAFVEWESWCRRVLAKHWPDARYYGDIHDVTTDELRGLGRIDLVTGGYPCQPFSVAGKRRGADDERHLWPEMRRVIDTVRPHIVLAENVAGHISMGLDIVLTDLEGIGYTTGAIVVPAGAVNALHRRDRVWILAISNSDSGGQAQRRQRPAVAGKGAIGRADRSRSHDDDRQVADGIAGEGTVGVGIDADRTGCQQQRWPESASSQHATTEYVGGAASMAHAGSEAGDVGTGLREGESTGGRRGRSDDRRGETAVADAERGTSQPRHESAQERRRAGQTKQAGLGGSGAAVPDTEDRGIRRGQPRRQPRQPAQPSEGGATRGTVEAEAPRTLDAGVDGVPTRLVRRSSTGPAEPDLIRAAWADGSWEADLPRVVAAEPDRRQKLQGAGNAIVPLVAYEILRALIESHPEIFDRE